MASWPAVPIPRPALQLAAPLAMAWSQIRVQHLVTSSFFRLALGGHWRHGMACVARLSFAALSCRIQPTGPRASLYWKCILAGCELVGCCHQPFQDRPLVRRNRALRSEDPLHSMPIPNPAPVVSVPVATSTVSRLAGPPLSASPSNITPPPAQVATSSADTSPLPAGGYCRGRF